MRIRRIKVRNYAGIDEAEVSFPDTGITIIEGDNEVGKSSMISAVDLILKNLDSSSAGAVKDVMTVGMDLGPEVEVDITAGPYVFTYRKRWLRDKETVLNVSAPSVEQLSGREAHARVREILDEAVDMELWTALRLDQGESLTRTSFDVSALGHALDAASGGEVAGDREDVLFDRIESEYHEYWTKGGSARGDYRTARDAVEEARARAVAAESHLEDLEGFADEIHKLEVAAVGLVKTRDAALESVTDLAEQVDTIARIRSAVERSRTDLERAELLLGNARQERERRDELIEAVDAAKATVEACEEEMKQAEPARKVAEAKQEAAKLSLENAKAEASAGRRALDLARKDSEYARQLIEIEQLSERRDRIDAAQELLAAADETLETISVDAALLAEIEDAHLDLAAAKRSASRSLPTALVRALDDVEVHIDGDARTMAPGSEAEVPVADTAVIRIGDVAEVTISAGADDGDAVAAAEAAQVRYDELCTRAGAKDFAEARERADARAQAERDRDDALKVIQQDLRDLTFEELTGKIERISKRTERFLAEREGSSPLPEDLDAAQEIERTATETARKADEALQIAENRAREMSEELQTHDLEGAGLGARLEIAESAVVSAQRTLVEARSKRPDDELAEAEATATKAVEDATEAVAMAEEELRDADPETVGALLDNAKEVAERSERDLRSNENRRTELRIELGVQTEQGPARDADEAASALVEAEAKHARLEAKAAAARLLYEVFARHRDAARQRYSQPFRDQIERLGRIVYGKDFGVGLSDDLAISHRTLDGTTLEFSQLSTGAREQLGLLARLACATLVADDGGAPVIFDDALGWSDPSRLERMGAAISTAADDCQIIILTCVPGRYAAVGKATTVTLN